MAEHSTFSIIQVTLISTIGAAIIFAPNILAENLIAPYIGLIIILAAGLLAFIQALCYAELGRIVPGGGGDATYLKKAFSPTLAATFNFLSFCAVIPACSAFGLSKTASALSLNGAFEKLLLVLFSLAIIFIPSHCRSFIFQAFFYLKIAVISFLASAISYLWWHSDGGCLKNPPASLPFKWFPMIKAFVNCTFFFSGYNTCNYLEMSAPLALPYTISALLFTLVYLFFTAGQYGIFSWEQITSKNTSSLLVVSLFTRLFPGKNIIAVTAYSRRVIEFVLYFGPVLGCHAVFGGIFSSHLSKDPITSYIVYLLYGILVYIICLVETADSILNNTSIMMSLFYCLTFLALFRLRRHVKDPINVLVPLVAFMVSGITTSINIYEKITAMFKKFKLF